MNKPQQLMEDLIRLEEYELDELASLLQCQNPHDIAKIENNLLIKFDQNTYQKVTALEKANTKLNEQLFSLRKSIKKIKSSLDSASEKVNNIAETSL